MGFFNDFPEYFETSQVGASPNRLNNRYLALIDSNKDIIKNSSILDLGSHDGRWSLTAIKNGASNVLGIEGRENLVKKSNQNMEFYKISKNLYSFKQGNVFEEIKTIKTKTIDVVFCFGLFYHIMDHMQLLQEIKRLEPKYLILDTRVTGSLKPMIKLILENSDKESTGIKLTTSQESLVGIPSIPALDLMLKNLGWEVSYYDWNESGIENWEDIEDYHQKKRVSLIAK